MATLSRIETPPRQSSVNNEDIHNTTKEYQESASMHSHSASSAFNNHQSMSCSLFPATSSYDYIDQHYIRFYMEDAIGLMMDSGTENQLIFDRVRRGQHIIGRRFEFIVKSPRNRAAFVKQLSQVLPQEKRYSIEELHQFTEILCPDFPVHALHHAEQLACHAQGMQGFESEPICIPPLNISAVTLGGLTSKSQTRTKPSLILENGPTLFSSIFMAAFRVCFIYHEFLVFMLNSIERQFESFKGDVSWSRFLDIDRALCYRNVCIRRS
ncbi:hypothetical protein BASA83_002814 [Batrachochytrium salamandrivorans]|nr:hypothetical protein BASA83_002814 [Batrachochytrium salamandrivorans]